MSLSAAENERVRALARKLRDERFNGSATELASAVGVSQSLMSRFLSGKTGTSGEVAVQIASLAGVDPLAVLHGDKTAQVVAVVESPVPPPISDTYVANDVLDGLVNAAFDPTRHLASDILPVVTALRKTAALMGDHMDHAAYARYLLDAQADARAKGKRLSPEELPFAALGVSHRLQLRTQALVDEKMREAEARILADGGTVLPRGETHPAIKRAQEIAKKKGQR